MREHNAAPKRALKSRLEMNTVGKDFKSDYMIMCYGTQIK